MYRIAFIISLVVISTHTVLGLSGSGTEEDPWRIESLEDFNDFAADANYWDGYTRLETDVNLAGSIYVTAVIAPDTNSSIGYFQGTRFTGVFDGNDQNIINLTIDGGANNDYLGLFGYIGESGQVRNLGFKGGSITGGYYVGGLVGQNLGSVLNCCSTGDVSGYFAVSGLVAGNYGYGIVSDCYSTAFVSGDECVGGLVGANYGNAYISNCYSASSVSGDASVGGLVGLTYSSISHCYSTGSVSGDASVGGLVGVTLGGSISNCYCMADVNGGEHVGGLAGYSLYGTVLNCYSNGDISGDIDVGGLVGGNERGSISSCYSTGDVNGVEDVGGLVGKNSEIVSNCFWDTDTQTHGVTESIGYNKGTAINVKGLPTSEMQTMSTFIDAGWDFEEIWDIGEKQTYPYLRRYLSADLNHDGVVNMIDFAILAGHWLEGAGQ